MSTKLLIAVLLVISTQLVTISGLEAQPLTWPDSKLVMSGLKKIYVRATSTEDAKRALKSIGENSGKIESDSVAAIKQRLVDIGLEVSGEKPTDQSKSDSELLLTIYTELTSGTVKVGLNLNEMVVLQRSPDSRLILTTWQRWLNPRSDESAPIKRAAISLTDQFIDSYLEANPRKAN